MVKQFNMNNISILQNMGFQVHVATNFEHGSSMNTKENKKLKIELHRIGVQFHQVDFPRGVGNPISVILALRQLTKVVEKNKFNFLHCQSAIGGVCGRIVGHKNHIKVIYTAHGFQFFRGSSKLSWLVVYPLEKYLSKYTDRLITINHEDFKLALRKFHAKKIDYVPGIGIDVEKIQRTIVDIQEKRKNIGIPQNAKVILSVGELNNNKNHSVVLEALHSLECKNVYYVICGIGVNKDNLIKQAKKYGIESKLRLLGYRTDVIQIMKACDVFIFPSYREGLPVSLMEAMAAHLPVIASKIRGNTDLIKNDVEGYLFNPNSAQELAELLKKIFENKRSVHKFVDEGSKKIQLFDQKVVEKKMKQIYASF